MDSTYIIRRPVLTEKSTQAMSEQNRYTFEVDRHASKTDIKRAVQQLYGVKVLDVTTARTSGRTRRYRYGSVAGKTIKKATVRLPEGQSIELF